MQKTLLVVVHILAAAVRLVECVVRSESYRECSNTPIVFRPSFHMGSETRFYLEEALAVVENDLTCCIVENDLLQRHFDVLSRRCSIIIDLSSDAVQNRLDASWRGSVQTVAKRLIERAPKGFRRKVTERWWLEQTTFLLTLILNDAALNSVSSPCGGTFIVADQDVLAFESGTQFCRGYYRSRNEHLSSPDAGPLDLSTHSFKPFKSSVGGTPYLATSLGVHAVALWTNRMLNSGSLHGLMNVYSPVDFAIMFTLVQSLSNVTKENLNIPTVHQDWQSGGAGGPVLDINGTREIRGLSLLGFCDQAIGTNEVCEYSELGLSHERVLPKELQIMSSNSTLDPQLVRMLMKWVLTVFVRNGSTEWVCSRRSIQWGKCDIRQKGLDSVQMPVDCLTLYNCVASRLVTPKLLIERVDRTGGKPSGRVLVYPLGNDGRMIKLDSLHANGASKVFLPYLSKLVSNISVTSGDGNGESQQWAKLPCEREEVKKKIVRWPSSCTVTSDAKRFFSVINLN